MCELNISFRVLIQTLFSYGRQGRYILAAGVVRNVDMEVMQTIFIDDMVIRFDDIISIEAEERSVFEQELDD